MLCCCDLHNAVQQYSPGGGGGGLAYRVHAIVAWTLHNTMLMFDCLDCLAAFANFSRGAVFGMSGVVLDIHANKGYYYWQPAGNSTSYNQGGAPLLVTKEEVRGFA